MCQGAVFSECFSLFTSPLSHLSFAYKLLRRSSSLFCVLDFWLLHLKKKNEKKGRKYATTREEADERGQRGGAAARDVSVLITQQRLALNLHCSGGSYEKRIIWYGNDTVFTLIGTDSRVGGRDEAETEQWNNSEGAATFPRPWMANVIFLQLRGGWGGVCVCWIYMWRMMWVCNFKTKQNKIYHLQIHCCVALCEYVNTPWFNELPALCWHPWSLIWHAALRNARARLSLQFPRQPACS